MFWGLIIEPNKRYTQTVERSFHVSMASLDTNTGGSYTGVVQVMLHYENRTFLLCTLNKGAALQVPLDLNFQEGTEIAFSSNGSGLVHLTGYLVPEEDDLDDELEEEEEEEDIPQLIGKPSKRKATDSIKQSQNHLKRLKEEGEQQSSDEGDDDDELDEEDDGSDSDELQSALLDAEEEEDEDDDDDDDDEGDEEEEEEEVVKPSSTTKKQKQQKQQQQQQQQPAQKQQNKKQEKQKLLNGKDVKQDQKQQAKQQKKNKLEQQVQASKQEQKKRVIEGGVQIEDLTLGSGPPAKAGKFVSVYYVGRFKNGKKFDSCSQGDGFKFRLGKNEVIQGWDIGIVGMKTGGKRRITIPPALAYGAKGSPPAIPPNSVLVFEVDLRNVH
ncbi:46 kDa FK506-binding nuclear protein [Neodiprion pinetum]|uniref:46 kDa FK506-binding nuclear protein n=1 Tax=Neodiprion pinetum TaxID=441929 RepID=UPI001EDE470A|nr:46 kDa FK506-binding nuclear protein-like [Neodiprion pinetum]XP_046625854.1 46 kDa FK506-binding nuclear protein-like [Neodiprion virginianus]